MLQSKMMIAGLKRGALPFALLALAPAAWAHVGLPGHTHGGAVQGMLHPWSGLDHLLAMITVGIWAALRRGQENGKLLWALPVGFMGGMALGGILGIAGMPLPGVEHAIAASVLLLGVAVAAAALRTPAGLALGLVALSGFFHGHAHGAEMAAGVSAGAYFAGMLLSTALLHGLGIGAMSLGLRKDWALKGARFATAGVAVCGALMLMGKL